MKKNVERNDFINLPSYPGGKKAIIEFVNNNLTMPELAIKNKINDYVFVSFGINNEGKTINIEVLKKVDFGCVEEAIRIVKLLVFSMPKNKGLKVLSTYKLKIFFDYRKHINQISYVLKTEEKSPKCENSNSYFYTVNIN